jgi:EAL domain-containing protein (putative c-di-GMP-specific phosphodiesterase class I)
VLTVVAMQVAAWREHDAELVPVFINVSAYQFRNADLAGLFSSYMVRYLLPPELIEIELPELSMVDGSAAVSQALVALRSMGIKLLVDNFGTRYSSLSQLQRLRFDSLKVDRAFTRQLKSSREGVALFRALVTMAHKPGLPVVAEGVENASQMRILEALRCDEVQGYYIPSLTTAGLTQAALREISLESRSFSMHP